MGNDIINTVTTIIVAIISLATLSVILSKGSNTTSVIDSVGRFLSTSIGAATKPVSSSLNLSVPTIGALQ